MQSHHHLIVSDREKVRGKIKTLSTVVGRITFFLRRLLTPNQPIEDVLIRLREILDRWQRRKDLVLNISQRIERQCFRVFDEKLQPMVMFECFSCFLRLV